MASAGSIFIDLLLKDAKYQEGLNRANSSSKRAFGQIRNEVNSTGQAFSSLGNVFKTAFAGLSAGALFTSFIRNTVAAQNEQAQLAAAIRSTGGAAGYTAQELNRMASSLSSNSTFSSGDITRAQTRLLTYTGILGQNLPRAMQAVIDQSARLGISVEQSAETIGRALERPSKAAEALARQGFGAAFTKSVIDSIKALERQGNTAAAQVRVLEILEESYAGAAAAARDTLGGALANLRNRFNDLLTGGSLPNLANLVNKLAENLNLMAQGVSLLAVALASRLIPGIIASGLAMAGTAAAAIRLNIALGTMAFGSTSAAVAMTALAGAARAASAALALVGGPIGLAVVAVFAAFSLNAYESAQRQANFNKQLGDAQDVMSRLTLATGKDRDVLLSRRDAILANAKAQVELTRAEFLRKAAITDSIADRSILGIYSPAAMGSSKATDEALKRMREAGAEFKELQDIFFSERPAPSTAGWMPDPEKMDKSLQKANEWLAKQREMVQTLSMEKDLIGLSSIEILKLRDARDLETEAAEKSANLRGGDLERFKEQVEALKNLRQEILQTNYEVSRSAETGIKEFFAEYVETATDSAQNIKRVLEGAFKGAEDAFVQFSKTGKTEFKSLVSSIIDDILRMQFRQGVSSILGALGGASGAGGLLGGLFGSQGGIARSLTLGSGVQGPLPVGSFGGFFAEGGNLGAGQWGIAGENGPELIYGGNTGKTVIPEIPGNRGNVYNIDATGADQGAVTRLENALLALAGPGVIERRVGQAQVRGAL